MIDRVYKGARTQRYHTDPRLARLGQNLADHQWGVASLVALLNPSASATLLKAALFHDAAEFVCGDLSAPTKNAFPQLKAEYVKAESSTLRYMGLTYEEDLTPEEQKWLKMADCLEACLYMGLYMPQYLERDDWQDCLNHALRLAKDLGAELRVKQLLSDNAKQETWSIFL